MKETQKNKILIVDDEPQIRRLVKMALELHDFQVLEAENGKEGLLMASLHHPAVILLDLGLPDNHGLTVLSSLREWSSTPVIVLTAENEEQVKITALDSGADDYVTKPFNTGELLARIRVALRHSTKVEESSVFVSGDLSVDLLNRLVTVAGQEVKLTVTEYSILALCIKHAGKVLTHNFIMREIWNVHYADNYQTLRVHIAQLRKKLEPDSSIPRLLITEPGVGYRLRINS